jgi:hypothetical protein
MDVFARTFLSAAAEAGVALPTIGRHLPVLSRCVAPEDPAALVARCQTPGRLPGGEFLLLLTRDRLVVTRENRLSRRLRLHLNTDLRHLHPVSWDSDPRSASVHLAATAMDGVRERFLLRAGDADRMWRLDAVLGSVFRPGVAAPPVPARPTVRREFALGRPAVALS